MKKISILFALVAMAFAAQAEMLTVAEGNGLAEFCPIYGYFMDTEGTRSQTIYPADMLTDMEGCLITEIKFYTATPFDETGPCNLAISLMEVDQDRFESTEIITGATYVGQGSPVQDETELVFVLDEPFLYNGGNLMIETLLTSQGKIMSSKFIGQSRSWAVGLAQYTYSWSSSFYYETEHVLPKATFTYEVAETPPEPLESCVSPNVAYSITDPQVATVSIYNNEPGATVYYEVYCNDELLFDGDFTGDTYEFVVQSEGSYVVLCYAAMDGKTNSVQSGVFFTIFPLEECIAPNAAYSITGPQEATVTIYNLEPGATVFYAVYCNDELLFDGDFTGDTYEFVVQGEGSYAVLCYAAMDGKTNSVQSGVFFVINTAYCAVPELSYQFTDYQQATVTITNHEPDATVYYEVYCDDELVSSGDFTGNSYSFVVEGAGSYCVRSYAAKYGMENSFTANVQFVIPTVVRGDANGVGGVDMDDLTALINYLLDPSNPINFANAASINSVDSNEVDMDDLTALINFLLNGTWDN